MEKDVTATTLPPSAAQSWRPGVFREDTSGCLIDGWGGGNKMLCTGFMYIYIYWNHRIFRLGNLKCAATAWHGDTHQAYSVLDVPPQIMRAETANFAFFHVCGVSHFSISQKVQSMGPELCIPLLDQNTALSKSGRYIKEERRTASARIVRDSVL